MIERALRDEHGLVATGDDDGDPLADEVERNLGELVAAGHVRAVRVEQRVVERIGESGLERRVRRRQIQHCTGATPVGSYAPSTLTTPSVNVPVLSVQRTSMLPRFSIALSRRTSTPRCAIIGRRARGSRSGSRAAARG